MVYAIYSEFFPDVAKKLNRVAKKCAKHGNPFIFDVKGEEIRGINNDNGVTEYYRFVMVEVEGTAKIDNWECVAVLECHAVGNIIRKINTNIDIPERFRHSENVCEHCNTKRNRNNLYVIHNVATDEWKQVGGDCLKLYTGGLSMEYVVAFLDGITELEEFNGNVGDGFKRYYSVRDVIAYAVEVIAKMGYFTANSNMPTRSIVGGIVIDGLSKAITEINNDLKSNRIPVVFSSDDFFKADTSSTVDAIIEYYQHMEDNSDFVHNVQMMLHMGYVLPKNIGYLCYLPEGYAKYIKQEVERVKRTEEKHFGEVGKRYKEMEVDSISLITSWSNEWGTTYVYKIVLASGEILTWKTTNCLAYDLNRGKECDKITFTVKEHSEYKGVKQTEITRCKVTYKDKAA